jgi:gliding motility-associated-like protein
MNAFGVITPSASQPGIYGVVYMTASACADTDTFAVAVHQPPLPPAVSGGGNYCRDGFIDSLTAAGTLISWYSDSGLTNLVGTGNIFYPPQNLQPGSYTYYVTQSSPAPFPPPYSYSCASNPAQVAINVLPPPSVNAGNDITICPGFTAHLNATYSAGNTYFWTPAQNLNNPNIHNPSANPDTSITYVVEVYDNNGCYNKDTIIVFVVQADTCLIHVYSGITPNGDGVNDGWVIDGITFFSDNSVDIFNRWGNLVWYGDGYDNVNVVWKGENTNGERLPDGTYFYIINIKDRRFKGWVELTR